MHRWSVHKYLVLTLLSILLLTAFDIINEAPLAHAQSVPAVTGTTPTNDTTPSWSWSSGGGTGTFRYKLDDADLASGTTETTATTFTPTAALSEGNHVLYVQEQDESGNWSASGSFAIVIDTTAPTAPSVTGTTPTNDNTPTWSWSVGAGGNGNYRYKLDDADLTSGTTETTATTYTPTAALSEGSHALYVQEPDESGNWSASGSFAIVIDTTAPTAPSVTGTTPTNDNTPTWSWSSGGSGSGTYRYKLDNSDLSTGATPTTATTFTPTAALSEESHILYVQEQDEVGNWSTSGSFNIVIDTTAPTAPAVTGTTPTNNNTPTWSWSSGGSGSGTYRYKLDNSDLSTGATQTTATTFTPTAALSEGSHILYVQERDELGNWSESGYLAIMVDTIASAAPIIAGTTPTNVTTPIWSWNSGGGGGSGTYRYKLDEGDLTTGATEATVTSFTPTSALIPGSHTLYVQERDAAGNWSANGSFTIVVDVTAPGTAISSTAANPTRVPIQITVTFSKVVTGFEVGDIVVGNGTAGSFAGSGSDYSFTVIPAVDGAFTVDIPSDVAHDSAGNSNTAAAQFSHTYDITAPKLATTASYVDSTHVEVTFSEVVEGADDPANYTASPDLAITGATVASSNTYRLTTTLQTVGTAYTVTAANVADQAGNLLSSSGSSSIFTRSSESNSAPSIPTLNAPPSGTSNLNESLTLTPTHTVYAATDTDGDPIVYSFEISPSSDFATIAGSKSGIASNDGVASWTVPPGILTDNTLYYWRCRAEDGDRSSGNMPTASYFINTANDAPTGAAISSPDDNSEVTTLTPVLTVNNATDLDRDALTYEFEVATESGFTNIITHTVDGLAEGTEGSTSWTVTTGKLADNTRYHWRCRAKDQHGAYSNQVAATFFVNTANDAPTAPTVNAPPDGSPNLNEISALTVTLTVNNASDPDNDTLAYTFEIDTINTFTSSNKQSSPLIPGGSGKTSWQVSKTFTDHTAYYWRAKANDGKTDSPWMETGSFFVNLKNEAPFVPTIVNPANNGEVPSLTPTLTVHAADVDLDRLTYDFEVYRDSGLTVRVAGARAQGENWIITPPLVDNTRYYWRAMSIDEHGVDSGAWSTASSFTVKNLDSDNQPPSIEITSPGAAEPVTNANTFSIGWNASDPDSPALITLYYGRDNSGQDLAQIVSDLSKEVSSHSWDTSAFADGSYYIYGWIADGKTTVSDSSSGPLVIDRTPPSAPVVSGVALTSSAISTWSWSTGGNGGNGTYRYKLDNDDLRSGASETASASYTSEVMSEGSHTLYVQERDVAGNWSKNGGFAVIVDTTAPSAPIVTGATPTNKAPAWNWNPGGAGGNGIYRYKLDDGDLSTGATETTSTSYTPIPEQSQGTHTLYIQERDAAGNWSAIGSFAITVDTMAPGAPAVTGTTPTNDTTPTWSWSPGNGDGSGTFRYKLDGDPASGATETTATTLTPAAALSEGSHILYVQEEDAAGNWSESGSFAIVIDTTAPTAPAVSGTTPTNDTTPSWTWSSGGGSGNGTYRYKLDHSDLSTGATETTVASFSQISPLGQGAHTLYVQEQDAAGNWSQSGSFAIVIDTTAPVAPVVSGSTPTNDTTPTWNWSAGAGGSGTFRYKLDDGDLSTGATQTTAAAFTPTAALSEGSHTLYVQERDEVGNWSESGIFAITVDTTASTRPIVAGTTPTNDATPTWSWNSGGGSGTYRYKLDNGDLATGATQTTATTFTPAAVQSEGSHTLYLQERDAAGNWSESGSFAIIIDTTAPTAPSVSGTTPTNDTTPTWNWSAGAGGNGTFRYKLGDGNFSSGATQATATTFTPTAALSEGSHTLFVQERDEVGNWSESGIFAIMVDTIASTAPMVVGQTPTNDTTPTWSWNSGGGGGSGTYRYKLDDSNLATGATQTTATTMTAAAVQSAGSHTLYVQEQDAAGNWSAGGSFTIVVDVTPPGTTISSTAANPTRVSPINITVTFSKDVTGLEIGDIMVSNGTAGSFAGSGSNYSLTVIPAADGAVTIDIPSGVARDLAGNDNTAAARLSRTYDITAPKLEAQASYVDSTHVDVTFNEIVEGADNPANYTASPNLAITGAALLSSATYRLTTTLQTVDASYAVSAANITDQAGNLLNSSASSLTFARPSESNSAPSIPSLNAPPSGTPNVNESLTLTPTLTVNAATDADDDPVVYTFEISPSSDFAPIAASQSGIAGSDGVASWMVPSGKLSDNTQYYWRCRANDGYRSSGNMPAASYFVNTANDLPRGAALSFPADGAEVSTLAPILTVNNASDLDNDTLTYEFEVATESGFTNIIAHTVDGLAEGPEGSTSWTVTAGKLADNTRYYWRCRAKDQHGGYGDPVVAEFFVNTANDAPTAPTVNAPPEGSPNLNELSALTVTLAVNNASDPDNDTLVYTFEIDTANTFTSSNKENSPLIPEASGTTSWQVTKTLTDNTTYYWRAKANDGKTDSPWMGNGRFFVNLKNEAPFVPTVVNPANDGEVSSLTPTLTVHAADVDLDRLTYDFEVYSDSALSTRVAGAKAQGENWIITPPLVDNTRYYWRALSTDQHGVDSGAWSMASSFTVKNLDSDNQPPMIEITSPGAAEPVTNAKSFSIGWSASDPDSPAFITLFYGNDNSGQGLTQIASGIGKETGSYSWDTSAFADGSYYIYGRIADGKTIVTDSSTGPLVIDRTPPSPPAVSATAMTNGTISTWSWSSGGNGGNGTYRYKLDNDDLRSDATETATTSYTSAVMTEGSHTLYVQERDSAGNWSENGNFLVLVDTIAPSAPAVTGTTPTNDTTPIWSWISGGGGGNGTYRYKLDDGDLASGATETTENAYTPVSELGQEAHTLYVQERDATGNWSANGSFTITVDTNAPRAVVSGMPSDPTNIQSATLAVSGEDVVAYKYAIDEGPYSAESAVTDPIRLATLSEGLHIVSVIGRDSSDNWQADTEATTVSWVVDLASPVFEELSILSDGVTTNEPVMPITGTVTDNTGVLTLTVTVKSSGASGTGDVAFDLHGNFNHAVELRTGANIISIIATDRSGNQTSVVRTVIFDTDAPKLVIEAPTDGLKTNKSFTEVRGDAGKTASVTMKVNGGTAEYTSISGTSFTATANLQHGLNTIELTATDLAGNTSTLNRTVTFDDQKPSLAVNAPDHDLRTNLTAMVIKGVVTDNLSAVTVRVTQDGKRLDPPPTLVETTNGLTFEQSVVFNGTKIYHFVVTATDEAGNESSVLRNIIYSKTAKGDINGDDRVDIADAMLALQISVGLLSQTDNDLPNGDVAPLINGISVPDGRIDIGDAVIILKVAVELVFL